MFYCEPCAAKNKWPYEFYMMQSRGPCEVCRKVATCVDAPSSALPERPSMMTPAEYESKELQDIADQVRAEHLKTGREVPEILEAMRDEGYIGCDDATLERCAALAGATGEMK